MHLTNTAQMSVNEEKLLKRFLLLLTNYCLIEDPGIGASLSAECTLLILCSDNLSNKAIWWSFEAFAHVYSCIVIVNDDQQDATILAYLFIPNQPTCFGRCLRPSSGALDCIYSF